jgi:hypothetical protein
LHRFAKDITVGRGPYSTDRKQPENGLESLLLFGLKRRPDHGISTKKSGFPQKLALCLPGTFQQNRASE